MPIYLSNQNTMGVCNSAEAQRNSEIEREQRKEFIKAKKSVKILLLGPGESGKSTILKQIRILRLNQFSDGELVEYRALVYSNINSSIFALVEAMEHVGIDFHKDTSKHDQILIENVKILENDYKPPSPELMRAIRNIWSDAGIQKCYKLRNKYQLSDNAKYFLDDLDRIFKPDFIPTEEDALRVRATTIGVVEMIFNWKTLTFRVIDVGGQRSERRKWIHQFENVDCILFVIALSEYDQSMREDNTMNRMKDALELFSSICTSDWFQKTEIILFLNKMDLFQEKIRTKPITEAFPDYSGEQTYEACCNYISEQFKAKNHNQKRPIQVRETCATDKNQIQAVIDTCIETIITYNLKKRGLTS